ncbi:hypothetical protein TorRG33x02_185330, partial [Trema orientale]
TFVSAGRTLAVSSTVHTPVAVACTVYLGYSMVRVLVASHIGASVFLFWYAESSEVYGADGYCKEQNLIKS